MTFDLCLFPVLPFFPLPWWSPFLHSSQAGSYSMMSCDLQEEGQEHLIDTSILIVFSTTGNWKEKAESKSCSDVWAPGKNTSTADRIFEETGKRNTQFYRGSDWGRPSLACERGISFPKLRIPLQASSQKIFQKFLNMSKIDFPSVHSETHLTIFAENFERIAQGRYLAWKLPPSYLCLTKLQATGRRFLQ